jgi:hypothetical protein
MIRFDPPTLFAALSAERERRGLTWGQVAAETGVAATSECAPARRFVVCGQPLELGAHVGRDAP